MSASEWIVLIGGLFAILWVNWYFFLAGKVAATAATNHQGSQEILIAVRGGYSPSLIHAKKGVPLRIIFDRQESSGCSEEIVFSEFGIRKFLPAFEKTAVEFTPEKEGSFEFTCGMSMLRGKLVVVAKP